MTGVPFNRPHLTGNELDYISEAVANMHLSGNGPFSRRCCDWIVDETGCAGALLTHSATAALEMGVALLDIGPGDEVIMPSFTFVSTANAVVLRGGVPVFVDIREDTLNLDESLVEDAVTPRTRAVLPVHYAGVGCEMESLLEVAAPPRARRSRGRRPGHHRHLERQGARLVRRRGRAQLPRDEERHLRRRRRSAGERPRTPRARGGRPGEGDRPQPLLPRTGRQVQLGRHRLVLPSERDQRGVPVGAARAGRRDHRGAPPDRGTRITRPSRSSSRRGTLRRPVVPDEAEHNAHMYYVLLPSLEERTEFIARLSERNVHAVFHYVPLHDSAAGRRYGRPHGRLERTNDLSDRLVRLPLWMGMTDGDVEQVVEAVHAALAAPIEAR